MRQSLGRIALLRQQKGTTLIEVLVAVALLGVIGGAFLATVSTGTIAISQIRCEVAAQNLARSQLEHTKAGNYTYYDFGADLDDPSDDIPPQYPVIATPPGYSVDVVAVPIPDPDDPDYPYCDNEMQKITITVYQDGEYVLQVEDIKVYR